MKKELQGFEEPEADGHMDSGRATLKRVANWKTQGYDGIQGYQFKNITSIYDR